MAIALKVLRFASLPSLSGAGTTTQLNNGAATKGWLIKRICFHNNQASAITLDLYVSQQGGANTYLYKGYSLASGAVLTVETPITLNHGGTGDKLVANCTNASSLPLDCVVDGIERDQ